MVCAVVAAFMALASVMVLPCCVVCRVVAFLTRHIYGCRNYCCWCQPWAMVCQPWTMAGVEDIALLFASVCCSDTILQYSSVLVVR